MNNINESLDPLKIKRKKSKDYVTIGRDMNQLYRMGRWVHRSGFYRPWKYRPQFIKKFWSFILGPFMVGRIPHTYSRLNLALKSLFPNINKAKIDKISKRNVAYMGELFLDMIFDIPNINENNYYKRIKIKNLHYLDDAYKEGKGVLLAALHIGQIFHFPAMMAYHKNKYEYLIIGTLENVSMFSTLAKNQPHVYAAASRNYKELSGLIKHHLSNNRGVILFYDFTKINHLRVPFTSKTNSFLKPTPQSIASLCKETGAAILPVIIHPNGEIGKSTIEFLDPKSIKNTIKKYKDEDKAIFHGELSIALNNLLNPYLLKYAHVWEELIAFGGWRYKLRIKFKPNITIRDFILQIKEKIINILENSYERERDDEYLKSMIREKIKLALDNLKESEKIISNKITWFDFFDRSGVKEIKNLLKLMSTQLKKKNEIYGSKIIYDLIKEI